MDDGDGGTCTIQEHFLKLAVELGIGKLEAVSAAKKGVAWMLEVNTCLSLALSLTLSLSHTFALTFALSLFLTHTPYHLYLWL